jgi:LysR family transcriptional regulator, glycine cleavage system transcriptional activator
VRLGIRAGLPLHGSGGLLTSVEGFRRTNGDALSVAVRVSQPVGLGELLEGKIDAAILRGERRQAGICSRRLVRTTWGGDDDYLVAPEATRDCVEIDALYRWLAVADGTSGVPASLPLVQNERRAPGDAGGG